MKTPFTEEAAYRRVASQAVSGRPTAAIVDLCAIENNFRYAERLAPGRMIMAVVKAEAYGHGAVEVSRRLVSLGAAMLGVALLEEGRQLREAGIKSPVLVMGPLFPEQADEVVRLGLTPVVFGEPFARALSQACRRQGRETDVHIKVDTGMGRIGLRPEDAADFICSIAGYPGLRISGLMTHFADADLRDKHFTGLQMDRFEALIKILEERGVNPMLKHAANSAALMDYNRALFNIVRPGLMLYGYNPLEAESDVTGHGLLPALSLLTRIAFLKKVPAGFAISYGRTFVTRRESLIATIPIGYADGYSRALSNIGEALVRGMRVKVAGRVCMDMTMLDVTDVQGVSEGDEVVLIGRQGKERITADEIGARIGTIPYEVLCGISSRVPRVYVG